MIHTLSFLEPGHFHAALLLKEENPRIATQVHVYASPGPERDAFMSLVESFNARSENPTSWQLQLTEAPNRQAACAALLRERRAGEAVVLAGRNRRKLKDIAALHAAGLWVLADKPWITHPDELPHLLRACEGDALAMDIMPDRHELLARLRKRVVATPEIFGEFAMDDPSGPAIELHSTHHLCKLVNGKPLRRPAWYYDVTEQGDGLVDVQSHLTDQAQWLVSESRAFDFETDIKLHRARRWTTPVSAALFTESTGRRSFPRELAPWVRDRVLQYDCNGEIHYLLCGVSVRQVAEWGQREPVGGGDLHGAILRGTRAVLKVEHGAHTDFVPEVRVVPRGDESGRGLSLAALRDTVARWQEEFPGLDVERHEDGYRFLAPPSLHSTHENHFAAELSRFLDYMDTRTWPDELQSRIRARYQLLAAASLAGSADDARA